MKPEERSVIGVLLLLFGISWLGFATVQPVPVYSGCSNGASTGYPPCWLPSPVTVLFYVLGTFAIILGVVMLISSASHRSADIEKTREGTALPEARSSRIS